MKRLLALVLFLGSSLAWAAPNPAEYTVTIHVVSSQVDPVTGGQTLNVVIEGTKYLLFCNPFRVQHALGFIVPGDYKAKLVSEHHKGTYAYAAEYQFLFPDQTTSKVTVIGESE